MLNRAHSAAQARREKGWRRFLNRLLQIVYRRNGFNPLPVIAGGFAGLILLGSLLLSLPEENSERAALSSLKNKIAAAENFWQQEMADVILPIPLSAAYTTLAITRSLIP